MSKLKKLNRLNKSKTLSAAMAVGLVVTNLVTVVPAFATDTATGSSHVMSTKSTISASTTVFDKKAPVDVVVTMTSAYNLSAIKNGTKSLVKGTDYTLDGTKVTIKAAYLSAQTVGTKSLKFDFDGGTDPYLKVTIKDSSSTISTTKATFNNTFGKGSDIKVKLTLNGNTLVKITNDGSKLVEDTDYTVSGAYVTIKSEYLATLADGLNNITFDVNAGTDPVLAVTVKADPDSVAALKGVTAANGVVTATLSKTATAALADFTVTRSIDGGAATTVTPSAITTTGAVSKLTVATVDAKDVDQSVVYSVSYKGGAAKSADAFVVVKKVDLEKPVITLKGDAVMSLKIGDTFTDPGVTVTDNVDHSLVAAVTGDAVNTAKAGTYIVKYNVSDKAGNAAVELTRKVIVSEPSVVDSASIKLTTSVASVIVNPAGVTEPVEVTAVLQNFPAGVEATIAFESTYGQIVKQETTTNGKVTVKLYPSEDSEKVTATIKASILVAKNPATGEVFEEYQNVKVSETTVDFIPAGSNVEDGSVYRLSSALSDQADRVFINLNQPLTAAALDYLIKSPAIFKVYDNKDANHPIAVKQVVKKDDDTLILILDRADVNFPLTDNVKHRVEIQDSNNGLIYFTGGADFILEDATYIKMMKVFTSDSNDTTTVKVEKNQLLVVFNEAVNDAKDNEAGFEYSAHNPKNWVIDGLNLKTDVKAPITFNTVSVKTATTEREGVVLTFNSIDDVNEFLISGTHKLQVNTLGDWASVTDKVNMVATQELQYQGVTFDNVTVDWYIDGDVNRDADGNDESPEQFVVNFSAPVSGGKFEIIVPDKTKTNPYENNFITLTEKDFNDGKNTDGFTVTKLDAVGQKYLIEMNQDWTKLYDTQGTTLNYHINRLNPVRLVAKGWVDMIGRSVETVVGSKVKVATHDLTLVEDTQSPYTTVKEQLTSVIGTPEVGEVGRDAGAVRIVMNEPVQYNDQDLAVKILPGETPSQQQDSDGGVDVATFEYIKLKDANGVAVSENITVEGQIVKLDNKDIEAARDYGVIVEPVKELTAGSWKLVIRAISDDVGNTMKTEEMPINITASTPADSLYIVAVDAHHDIVSGDGEDSNIIGEHRNWLGNEYAADLDNTDDAADIIHILFNKDMSLIGDNAILNKGNYRLDGVALPVDGTEIVRGIRGENGMETSKQGVTIILPDGYLQERDNNHTLTIMNVSDALGKFSPINDRVQLPYSDKFGDVVHVVADPAVTAATDAVVKAEASKTKADVDAALALINALPASATKTTLLARANAIVVNVDPNQISGATGTTVAAAFGSTVTIKLPTAAQYNAVNYQVFDANGAGISAVTAIGTATTVFPAQAVGAIVKVQFTDANGVVVGGEKVSVTLTAPVAVQITGATGTVAAAAFGSTVTIKLPNAATYNVTQYKVYDANGTAVSAAAAIGEGTTVFPAIAAGTTVKVQFMDASGVAVGSMVSVTL